MAIDVRERTIEEIQDRLKTMSTDLNKVIYLESALKGVSFNFEIKRFIWGELADLYEGRGMFEKAARAMANKAGMEIVSRDRTDSYIDSAELFAKVGKVEDADEMFVRAMRDVNSEQAAKVKLARKNIYFVLAKDLEIRGKRASAVKFYEKLIKMKLDEIERAMVKEKLLSTYKALGMFREARLLGE